jgi:RimJ/RimL family protein N-acetyltransferase
MIRFKPFDPVEFKAYSEIAGKQYAEEKVKSGNWEKENAPALAEREFKALLPNGIETKDNYLYSILEEKSNEKVGFIWIASNVPHSLKNDLFIYDFEIFESFRRKGYAIAALKLLEEKARELGKNRISLHVFGQNQAARKLYQKSGFEETNVVMSKKVS